MNADEWIKRAMDLMTEARAAAQSEDANKLQVCLVKMQAHLHIVPSAVPDEITEQMLKVSETAHQAILDITFKAWNTLASDLDSHRMAMDAIVGKCHRDAKLINLQPIKDVADSLAELLDDVKTLTGGGLSAPKDLQKRVENILKEVRDIIAAARSV
ncbi:MAG: hypothetical protein V1899_01460 [Planctomycetota bacterium]